MKLTLSPTSKKNPRPPKDVTFTLYKYSKYIYALTFDFAGDVEFNKVYSSVNSLWIHNDSFSLEMSIPFEDFVIQPCNERGWWIVYIFDLSQECKEIGEVSF